MTWIYIILGIIGFLVLFNWIGSIADRIGLKTTIAKIGHFVFICLRGGRDGTELRLKVIHAKRSVRVTKHAPRGEEARLIVSLDHSDCPPEELARAAGVLSEMRVENLSTEGQDRLEVLCKDAEEATVVAQAILARVFGVTPATMLRAGWRGPLDVRQRTLYGPDGYAGWLKSKKRTDRATLGSRDDCDDY